MQLTDILAVSFETIIASSPQTVALLTAGMEIICQLQGPLHDVFVPVHGGGLITGIAAYIKRVQPEIRIIGVEPTDANSMALALYHGQRVMLEHV